MEGDFQQGSALAACTSQITWCSPWACRRWNVKHRSALIDGVASLQEKSCHKGSVSFDGEASKTLFLLSKPGTLANHSSWNQSMCTLRPPPLSRTFAPVWNHLAGFARFFGSSVHV